MNQLINVLRYLRYTKLIVYFFIQSLSILYTGLKSLYMCVCLFIYILNVRKGIKLIKTQNLSQLVSAVGCPHEKLCLFSVEKLNYKFDASY